MRQKSLIQKLPADVLSHDFQFIMGVEDVLLSLLPPRERKGAFYR